MAIAVDATSAGTGVTDTSLTWSHTCTGSDLILFVGCGIPTADTITGVTYATVAMTLVNKVLVGADRYIYIWYLVAPATGANNIVVTSSSSHILRGAAVSYTGASQTGVPDAQATNTGTGTTLTGTVTTVADNSWLIAMFKNGAAGGFTAGANTTLRNSFNNDGALEITDSNAVQTPPGSFSQVVTCSSSDWGVVVASFAPPAAVVAGVPFDLTSKTW